MAFQFLLMLMALPVLSKGKVDVSSWVFWLDFLAFFFSFQKSILFILFQGRTYASLCLPLGLLWAHLFSNKAITQKQREMLSCCSLIPSPWSNHVILSELFLPLKNCWPQFPPLICIFRFFSLKIQSSRDWSFYCSHHWSESIPPWHFI